MSDNSADNNITTPEEETSNNNSSSETDEAEVAGEKHISESEHDLRVDRQARDGEGDDDLVRDIIMWRRKKISLAVMAVATVLWLLLEIYGFNFLPIACWTAIGFTALLFLYGCILSFRRKEVVGEMKKWEVSEERAKEMGEWAKRGIEKGIRTMFHISCEREWYVFTAVISALLLLAYLGRRFTLLTLLYSGTMMAMTVPVVYKKKEEQIKAYGERVKMQGERLYSKIGEKILWKARPKKELNVNKHKKVQ